MNKEYGWHGWTQFFFFVGKVLHIVEYHHLGVSKNKLKCNLPHKSSKPTCFYSILILSMENLKHVSKLLFNLLWFLYCDFQWNHITSREHMKYSHRAHSEGGTEWKIQERVSSNCTITIYQDVPKITKLAQKQISIA